MDTMWDQAAFRSYAICTAILALKMLCSAVYTGTRRQKHGGYVNAEDARVFGGGRSPVLAAEAPALERARGVWDAARLERWLAQPDDEIPGNFMGNAGQRALDGGGVKEDGGVRHKKCEPVATTGSLDKCFVS